jgi:hypothetical protein
LIIKSIPVKTDNYLLGDLLKTCVSKTSDIPYIGSSKNVNNHVMGIDVRHGVLDTYLQSFYEEKKQFIAFKSNNDCLITK